MEKKPLNWSIKVDEKYEKEADFIKDAVQEAKSIKSATVSATFVRIALAIWKLMSFQPIKDLPLLGRL